MKKFLLILSIALAISNHVSSQESSNWSYDVGFNFFKSSLNNQPDELLFNPVFEKWEHINHTPSEYSVNEYKALDPYSFTLNLGFDALFRYKKYLMIKVGYVYSNTLGIGGKGNIAYSDINSDIIISEEKEMRFSAHQFNYFIGPLIPISDKGSEVYMGFSMMSPTFVTHKEKYIQTINNEIVSEYNKTFNGFFGNCRSVIGMQIPLSEKWRFGSEVVFAYFNGMEVASGDLVDEGFVFPLMQWNFTFRYNIK